MPRRSFLVFTLLLISACRSALADSAQGDICTGRAGQVYTNAESAAYPGTNSFICNGSTLQNLTKVLANPTRYGIGTASPAAALDVNGEIRTTGNTLNCTAATTGAIRYNSITPRIEFCDGAAWQILAQTATSGLTAPPDSGYFVLSNGTWTGNLGGLSGADAKCLSDLTTNTGWAGYSAANSNGQLIAGKIHAFLCDGIGACNNLTPLATYYFANAADPSAGGGSFTTDSSGLGPNSSVAWSAFNRFNNGTTYWTDRGQGSSTAWPTTSAGGTNLSCAFWTTSANGNSGVAGISSAADNTRWDNASTSCTASLHLVCYVNP